MTTTKEKIDVFFKEFDRRTAADYPTSPESKAALLKQRPRLMLAATIAPEKFASIMEKFLLEESFSE